MRGREGQVGTLVDHRITTMSESFLNAAGQRTADLHMQRAESRVEKRAEDILQLPELVEHILGFLVVDCEEGVRLTPSAPLREPRAFPLECALGTCKLWRRSATIRFSQYTNMSTPC